jgi:hypothetical protein
MTVSEKSAAVCTRKPTRYPADPKFYYRIDTVARLRDMRYESVFKPRRWDLNANKCPHASLLTSLDGKQQGEGIFRISFWINEQEGRAALEQFSTSVPHLLLRVSRSQVAEALQDWRVEEDEFLRGRADLIWSICPAEAGDDSFHSGGIPLDALEVWLDDAGWQPWFTAKPLQPERVRMASIGWSSVVSTNGWGQPVICHWQVVPSPPSYCQRGLWCLCMLDEECGGSFGGDTEGVCNVMDSLLDGPLAGVEGRIAGVLTVHVGEDRLWTEQYRLGRRRVHGGGMLRSIATRIGLLAWQLERFVEPNHVIPRYEEMALVRAC